MYIFEISNFLKDDKCYMQAIWTISTDKQALLITTKIVP